MVTCPVNRDECVVIMKTYVKSVINWPKNICVGLLSMSTAGAIVCPEADSIWIQFLHQKSAVNFAA